jgi:hypothetical protein
MPMPDVIAILERILKRIEDEPFCGSGLISAYGQYQQGQQAAKAAEMNAQNYERQADLTRQLRVENQGFDTRRDGKNS